MARICAIVEYDGRDFAGWQAQRHSSGIQSAVESALAFVAGHSVETVCAGRTDAGVHALGQVIHFDTVAARTPRTWVLGANTRLPAGIALQWAAEVDGGFHARHKALQRTYRYCILNRAARSPIWQARAAWIHRPLDAAALHALAQVLIGEHDFAAFRSAECQSKTSIRTIERIAVNRSGDCIWLEISARGFLHHMVRNIVGTLLKLHGAGEEDRELRLILASLNRRRAGPTAPAAGLYLWQVRYAAQFNIGTGLSGSAFPTFSL